MSGYAITPFAKAKRLPALKGTQVQFSDALKEKQKRKVDLSQIAWMEGFGHYTLLYLLRDKDGKRCHVGLQHRMADLEKELDELPNNAGFRRVDFRHIVNVAHVDQADRWLCNVDGQLLPVHALYSEELVKAIAERELE